MLDIVQKFKFVQGEGPNLAEKVNQILMVAGLIKEVTMTGPKAEMIDRVFGSDKDDPRQIGVEVENMLGDEDQALIAVCTKYFGNGVVVVAAHEKAEGNYNSRDFTVFDFADPHSEVPTSETINESVLDLFIELRKELWG